MQRSWFVWLIGILALASVAAIALAAWLLFPPWAEAVSSWPDLPRQAAYGLSMLHALAVMGVVRLVGRGLAWSAKYVRAPENFEDSVVPFIALWGAALPFILIGERYPQTHAGGVALGVVAAAFIIVSVRIARQVDRGSRQAREAAAG